MEQIIQAIVADTLPVLGVLVKGVVAALVVGGLAQMTVKMVLSPVAASEKTPDFLTPLASGMPERLVTLFIAQLAVVAAHACDVWSYGSGPKGYASALLFGFLGGGLMPAGIEWVKARKAAIVPPGGQP